MTLLPYRILERKRAGMRLSESEIRAFAFAAADGSWAEGQLGAFLMAAAIRGLDVEETRALTLAMLESGERWNLGAEVPRLCDKHSTGGVGDKVSLVIAPLLASLGLPVAMLAGRGLGHTGGTIDKLESIPGIDSLELDRARCLDLLARCGMVIGGATGDIAPADRRLYSLRDATATVDSIPLITASILSKKLAVGTAGVVFDVKTGNGAFLPELERSRELALGLVGTCRALGTPASCLITDMSQPMGRWTGNAAEVREALEALAGNGPADLMEVTYALAEEVTRLVGQPVTRREMEDAIASGRARERFERWAELLGAHPAWLRRPELPLAPVERPLLAARSGRLAAMETRQLGLLLVEAGGGRARPGDAIDFGVALEMKARLGDAVEAGQELARVYLRRENDRLVHLFGACFTVADEGVAPPLIAERVA